MGSIHVILPMTDVIFEQLAEENRPFNSLGQPHLPSNNAWYRESAEAHSRLADILAQLFG